MILVMITMLIAAAVEVVVVAATANCSSSSSSIIIVLLLKAASTKNGCGLYMGVACGSTLILEQNDDDGHDELAMTIPRFFSENSQAKNQTPADGEDKDMQLNSAD
ncbi:hypothetical protein DPMN_082515 [Dreissena polymorpha]|uniref:Secreted protein n=1 Tax=Dreissena polymorpha TaxID=45954 RepID=A0A9D4BHJ2_DREPO|nr:hypothetical protein DPMN_082515 [Dreissena polymorpha]